MEIILLERVEKLGAIGDIVRVKPGFARNFLLPKGKALRATAANKERFEREREAILARNAADKADAESVKVAIDSRRYVAIRSASETGLLYGSVSTRDIAEMITAGGQRIARGQVELNQPIKTLGLTDVTIRLHGEVTATVTINIARSEEEAELQASGVDVVEEARRMRETEADEMARDMAENSFRDEDGPADL
ncbi:MAG: 50S ribosomal protein L9 [Alphaproteobacteria bacterium]|jgi:large subunit ribosomal protein L9|nr:50S ribosomal protein L9 [Alphaproteobacteria bacterium]